MVWAFTIDIRKMKLREENKPDSMQNERAQRDHRVETIQEMKDLKEICCSEAERTRGLRADDFLETN